MGSTTIEKKCNLSGSMCVPVLLPVTLFPNTVTKICNLSGDICVPVLSAATRVTLLPKDSLKHLQFKWRYLCPCVTCGYPCNPVTKLLKFAI